MNASGMAQYFLEQAGEFRKRGFSTLEIVGALAIAQQQLINVSVRIVPASPILPAGGLIPPLSE